jgi:hypothetical protein
VRYERDLGEFEQRYGIESPIFYQRFEAEEMGDAMDYCQLTPAFAFA